MHPDLCPFNTGPHWLGGYNEATSGVALVQAPSRKAQTGGGPWISAMYHALRSLPSPKVGPPLLVCRGARHMTVVAALP